MFTFKAEMMNDRTRTYVGGDIARRREPKPKLGYFPAFSKFSFVSWALPPPPNPNLRNSRLFLFTSLFTGLHRRLHLSLPPVHSPTKRRSFFPNTTPVQDGQDGDCKISPTLSHCNPLAAAVFCWPQGPIRRRRSPH